MHLDQQLLDGQLGVINLALQLAALGGNDGGRDDGARDIAGTAQGDLARHKNVGHVLVFAQQGQVQQDFQRLSISSQDDELRDTAVQGLGG